MHPFLDVNKLSDEEIIERLGKAYTYMNNQVALGHAPTVKSIKEIIHALETERQSRMTKLMDEEFKKKYSNALDPISLGKLED